MRYFIVTYAQQANGKYNEHVKLDDKIRKRDQVQATLILDYKDRKILKCRVDAGIDKDFDKISNFYKGHYAQAINGLEAKFQALHEIKEEIKEAIDIGAAAQDNPEIIQEEIDNEIVADLKEAAKNDAQ